MNTDSAVLQIDINALAVIATFVFSLAGVATMFVRLERRLNQCLSREEHQKICSEKHEELKEKLDRLYNMFERYEEYSTKQRHALREDVQRIANHISAVTGRSIEMRTVKD